MFDIAFSELFLIALVALIVIGPQRLPSVARTLGHLLGRMQRYVNDVKADIAREVELDELRKLQHNIEDTARSFEQSVSREVDAAQSQLTGVEEALSREVTAVQQQIEAKPDAEPGAAPDTVAGEPDKGEDAKTGVRTQA
jgi:sec-independent protein translocase protein TatB